jgi:hypothetical protein
MSSTKNFLKSFYLYVLQSGQREKKSRMQPHLLFYRNVCLSLIVQSYTCYTVVLLVAYLSKNQLLIN